MGINMLTAVIAALSALLGALVPTVASHVNANRQRTFELKKDLLATQRKLYADVMNTLQRMVNGGGDSEFPRMQEALIEISILGDAREASRSPAGDVIQPV